jgi:hypothetical protein
MAEYPADVSSLEMRNPTILSYPFTQTPPMRLSFRWDIDLHQRIRFLKDRRTAMMLVRPDV